MFVKPTENPEKPGTQRVVRKYPSMVPMLPEGEEVPEDFHYLRLLRDGDIEPAVPPQDSQS